jgi:hypothetical protein
MSKWGSGHTYKKADAWHLQFYQTENHDGELVKVRKWVKLADRDREHNSATCSGNGASRTCARLSQRPRNNHTPPFFFPTLYLIKTLLATNTIVLEGRKLGPLQVLRL